MPRKNSAHCTKKIPRKSSYHYTTSNAKFPQSRMPRNHDQISCSGCHIMLQQQNKQQKQQQQRLPSHDQTNHSTLIPTRKHQWCHDSATGIDRIFACMSRSLFIKSFCILFCLCPARSFSSPPLSAHLCYRTSNVIHVEPHCLSLVVWRYMITTLLQPCCILCVLNSAV